MDLPGVIPGWGHWGMPVKEPKWARDAKAKAERARAEALAGRADAKKPLVIISEKYDRKAAAFTVPSVPFPFPNKEAFERSMRMPLGRDFNTDAAFRDLTRPKVLADAGALIDPIRFAEAKAEAKGAGGEGGGKGGGKGGGIARGRPGLGEERHKRKPGGAAGGAAGGKKRRQ